MCVDMVEMIYSWACLLEVVSVCVYAVKFSGMCAYRIFPREREKER